MGTATPLPSATVILARDCSEGFEVLMVKRHHQIDFASGALVFPGGKSDDQDTDEGFKQLLQEPVDDPVQRGLQVTALREAFEECGILLALRNGELLNASGLDELDSYRDDIYQKKIRFADFLAENSLVLANSQLQIFAHWITPKMMAKRFDTWFYLAPAPANQIARYDQHEAVDGVWITPAQAIVDAQSGKHTIIFPTLRNIARLNEASSLSEAQQQIKERALMTVEPWLEKRNDGTYLCIPPEAGYDISEEKMTSMP